MAFFDRCSSAPSLHNVEEIPTVMRAYSIDLSDEDSITSEPDPYTLNTSSAADLCSQSLSESEQSPVNVRKKRRAPPPPPGPYPSPGSLRHSYAFELSNRMSSDSESLSVSATASLGSSRLLYQNSTDSENIAESVTSENSQYLATSDQEQSPSAVGQPSPQLSGKDKSRLWALKNALRSPNILRKSARREEEDVTKSSRSRKHATVEVPVCLSGWTLAFVPADVWEADCEFEVKRIPDYDKYLNDLLDETDTAHPDYEDLVKAAGRVRTMVREREEEEREAEQEERMDDIQHRFPYDDLQLKDGDSTQASKARGLGVRRRSAPSAVVFRSISGGRSRSSSVLWPQGAMLHHFSTKKAADPSRAYVMEGPVQFAMGMQTQDRYLFLMSDVLLVAKQKNTDIFKLKVRVPLCDVWLSSCVDEVTELTRPLDKSFVIGWPTYNVVATFRDTHSKEKWLTKLTERIQEEKQQKEPSEIPLKVVLKDGNKTCQLTVTNTQQAKDVLHGCLAHFSISDSDSKDYKLWVLSNKEVYPLIGHETPFSIQVSHLREVGRTRGEDSMTLEELQQLANQQPSNLRCQFILRQKKTPKKHSLDEVSHKSMKKSKKSSPLLNIFKRTGKEDKASVNAPTPTPTGKLFGLPLATVWRPDDAPPKPIADILAVLCRDGPKFVGILRKNANARYTRELRFRLDQGEQLEEVSAVLAGGLLKDYLRSLPDPLLTERLHNEWMQVAAMEEMEEKLQHIKQLLSQVPSCNTGLLKRVLCALHHIQLKSEENKMNSFNLSLCIAPSLLWHKDHVDLSGAAPAVEVMIDHCVQLFGPEVLRLLHDPKARPDSGTDSDSYHSVLSNPETGNSDSIDSLVDRELFTAEGEGEGEEEEEEEEEEGESCPPVMKSHLSPSNLSRDSGLTLSDTQLYEEECADPHHAYRHRSAPLYTDRDEDESDSCHLDPPLNPVPPPRKKGKRQGTRGSGGHAARMDCGGAGQRGRDMRHTLHSSLSSSRLQDHLAEDSVSADSSATMDSLRSARTLPLFSNMADVYNQAAVFDREELREYNRSTDIGLLRKSASGAHLILEDEVVSRKCSDDSLSGAVVFRQTSGVDSTPPHSPQSKYSFSSRDSIISDSSQGAASRESSVTSAPQTPDTEYADRLPPWLPALDLDGVGERHLARSLTLALAHRSADESGAVSGGHSATQPSSGHSATQPSSGHSATQPSSGHSATQPSSGHSATQPSSGHSPGPSASDSPVPEIENQEFQPLSFGACGLRQAFQAASSLPWPGRSREAEDVTPSPSPHILVTQCSSRSEEKLDDAGADEATPRSSPSFSADVLPLELAHGHGHGGLPVKQMSRYSHNLAKVSPPPRVLLQSLRSPRSGKDPAPLRASYDSDIVAQVLRAGFTSPRGNEVEEDVEVKGHSSVCGDSDVSTEGAVGFSAQAFDAAQSMEDAINDTEYIPVKPRLTIIRREESVLSTASSHSSASSVSSATSTGQSSVSSLTLSTSPSAHSSSSSTSSGSSVVLAGDQARPSRPPEYAEAVKRSLILKQETPLDEEAQAQIEASRKAKYLFEISMQMYLQDRQRQTYPPHAPAARKVSDPGTRGAPGAVGGQGTPGTERRRCVSPDLSAASRADTPNVSVQGHRASSKHPRQIYLESLQRYEQQQTVGAQTSGLTTKPSEPASSSTAGSERDCQQCAEQDAVGDTRTGYRTVQVSETRVQLRTSANRTRVPKDARPRSMLDLPFSSLHRSYSDSSDRSNKSGFRGPPCHSGARDSDSAAARPSAFRAAQHDQLQSLGRKRSDTAVPQTSEPRPPRRTYLTASCFYHPHDSPRSGASSPASSSPRAPSPRPQTAPSKGSRTDGEVGQQADLAGGRSSRSESPVPGTSKVVTAATTPPLQASSSVSGGADYSSSRAASDIPGTTASSATSSRPRSQLGWSVKSLARLYTTDANSGSEQSSPNPPWTTHTSSGGQTGPPPYHEPPPFRRLQDKSRMSTSSSSSSSTGRSGSPTLRAPESCVGKEGPQSTEADLAGEDGRHQSTRWSRGRSVSSGVAEQEATNPHTDISYV